MTKIENIFPIVRKSGFCSAPEKKPGGSGPPGGFYFCVGSISVGLGTGCSLCSTMARMSSTVPLRPKKLLLMQKS